MQINKRISLIFMNTILKWRTFLESLRRVDIKNICVGIGVFDGVHIGHAELLQSLADYAKQNNSYPLAITFSPHPRALTVPEHAPKLLVPLNQRIELLKKNGAEDVFVIDFNRDFANLEAEEFLRVFCLDNAVKIDCICVGKNWRFGKNGAGDTVLLEKFCQANNIDCRLIEELKIDSEKISSANIRIAVANGFLDKVRNMLGRPYFIHGTVVKGFSFAGDKLGHPTANLKPDSEILPPDGVYAAKAVIDDAEYLAAVNIGVAPSFDFNCRNHRIEVHLLDFDGNLYGRELDIMLLKYLRNERFFESAEALKEQIIKDIQQIKSLK